MEAAMKWMNYNHLYYFWMVAREGGVVRASEELMVSQPTVSNQLRELEKSMGQKLFQRAGRGLRLTEAGRVAFNYANEIFSLGQEMLDALEHRSSGPVLRLAVGLLDVIPKPVAHQLLLPALKLPDPMRLICREDKADRLLADLAARRTELVLSDSPVGTAIQVAAHNHLLSETALRREMDLQVCGRAREVREHFYAITLEEKPTNPAVVAICRQRLPES